MGGGGVFALLSGRGWIRVSDEGLWARNIVTSTSVPWSEVVALEAGSKVGVVLRNGQTWWFWAVQRANISGMLNRRSRVDRVVAEIEVRRTRVASLRAPANDTSRKSLVRPAWWEWIVIAGYVAAAIVGLAGV
ncbi:PH domain-containing protein [Isoptericola hypogeus]